VRTPQPTRGLCQTCGADPTRSLGTRVIKGDIAAGTCPACGRALALPFARATVERDAPAVEYEMEDWPAEERAAIAEALTERAVPFAWEAGLVLVVAAHREADADAVFADLDIDPFDEVPEEGELAPAEEGWGDGEDAFKALGDLFDAADRLFHTPTGTTAANDLREAGAVVRRSAAPYGFNPVLWRTGGELAGQLEQLIDQGASNDDIRAGAEALRDVLHEHI
jgi:hypothetical protein